MTFHMPDSWYEPPGPDADGLLRQANEDADMLVSEWADSEWEVEVSVWLERRALEPIFDLRRVAQDGEVFYDAHRSDGIEFDTIEELREYMEREYPLQTDD